MSEREKRGRADDARDRQSAEPRLEQQLNEAPINQLLADGYGRDQRKEHKALHVVLGENLQRELRYHTLNLFGTRDKPAQTQKLTCKDYRGQYYGHCNGQTSIGN